MKNAIERGAVMEALECAGLEADALRELYSGRGMYGATCFGVVLGGLAEYGQWLAALAVDLGSADTVELAAAVRTDAMGLETIYYFPGWELA